jgi:hypothetical protein
MVNVGVCEKNPIYFSGRDWERFPIFQPVFFQPLEKATIYQQSIAVDFQKKSRSCDRTCGTKEG